MKGDKLGRQGGSGSQKQPRMEIMKGDKLGRQGGSGTQEQPRREIMKGDKRRQRQPRAARNEDHEGRQAWETRRQRQHDRVQPSHWEVRTPIAYSFQLSGENIQHVLQHHNHPTFPTSSTLSCWIWKPSHFVRCVAQRIVAVLGPAEPLNYLHWQETSSPHGNLTWQYHPIQKAAWNKEKANNTIKTIQVPLKKKRNKTKNLIIETSGGK